QGWWQDIQGDRQFSWGATLSIHRSCRESAWRLVRQVNLYCKNRLAGAGERNNRWDVPLRESANPAIVHPPQWLCYGERALRLPSTRPVRRVAEDVKRPRAWAVRCQRPRCGRMNTQKLVRSKT